MSSALSSELRTRFREYIEEGLQHVAFYQSQSCNRKRVRPKGEAAFFCFRLNATCSKRARSGGAIETVFGNGCSLAA